MSPEEKNLILFEKMAKKMIDGDFENFQEATSLLATWLSKRQAYYPGALIQIIRLLFIAQLRVRNEVKFDQGLELLFKAHRYNEDHFAAAYIKLVNAIIPFEDVFAGTEKGLREGYQQLIATISADLPERGTPPIKQNESPTQPPTNPVEPASAHKSVSPPTQISATGQIPSVTVADPVLEPSSPQDCIPEERINLEVSTSAETRSPATAISIPHQIESSRSSPSSGSKENTNLKPDEHHVDATETQPTPPSTLLQQIGITTLDGKAPDPSAKDEEMELLCKEAHTAPEGQQQSNDNVDQTQAGPIVSYPGADIPAYDIPADSLQGLHGVSLPLMTQTAGEVTNVDVNNSQVSATLSIEQNLPLGCVEVANQMEVDLVDAQQTSPETDNTTEMSGDVDAGRNEVPSHESIANYAMVVDDSGLGHIVLPPAIEEVIDLPTKTINPTQLHFPPANVEMGVIARQPGLNGTFRIFIDFDISSNQFELVKKWSNRLEDPTELKSSVCITLGCYLLADLKEQFDTGGLSSFDQQVTRTPSKWPQQRGSLNLKVISAELKEENLPLSPPFQVTPNNLLDISSLVAEGKNKVQVHQTTDLRDFIFALHAHHPTRQQLEQVQDYMHKREEWQQFLQEFSAPLAYDSLSLLSGQALKV